VEEILETEICGTDPALVVLDDSVNGILEIEIIATDSVVDTVGSEVVTYVVETIFVEDSDIKRGEDILEVEVDSTIPLVESVRSVESVVDLVKVILENEVVTIESTVVGIGDSDKAKFVEDSDVE